MKLWKVAAVLAGCAWASLPALGIWVIWTDETPEMHDNLAQTGYVMFLVAMALSGLTEWLRSEDD